MNINDINKNWDFIIGLEIHVQLDCNSKIFSNCQYEYDNSPNSLTCPTSLGLPGALPNVNQSAIESAIMFGKAVNGKISKNFTFARKHYFYPDLPKGYQISQFDQPIISGGSVPIWWNEKEFKIDLTRAHLEEDAGKSFHNNDSKKSNVDYNRSGAALIEIVTEPVIVHPEQAKIFMQRIKQIVNYINISNAEMEKGKLRCDANISLSKKGSGKFGVKTEIKNINSFRNVQKAIESEIIRQNKILNDGKEVQQATLTWNNDKNVAEIMRMKENADDYRYFPDPDLLPLEVTDEFINKLKSEIPELPDDKKKRFIDEFKVSPYDATILVSDIDTAKYFEEVVAKMGKNRDIKLAVNWITGGLFAVLNEKNIEIAQSPISAKNLAKLINLIKNGTISGKIAKTIFELMLDGDIDPQIIVEEKGLKQESDPKALEALIDKIINDNREKAIEYKQGKEKLFGFFVGQAMKASGGKANPQLINEILKKKL